MRLLPSGIKTNFSFLKILLPIFALVVVWSTMMPLFAGPDEHSNFIKSAAIVRGEIVGENIAATPTLSYWTTHVDIDPRFGTALAVPSCFIFASDKPACDVPIGSTPIVDNPPWTQMGRYPPIAYVVSGVGTIFGPRDLSAYASRFIIGLLCALFVAVAVHGVRRRGRTALGLMMALTPGVVFISAVNSTSGVEICAAFVLWTLLPEMFAGRDTSSLEKVFLGLGGVILIGARPLGFAFYLTLVGLVMCLSWPNRHVFRVILKNRLLVAIHSMAMLFSLWWFVWIYNYQTSPKVVDGMPAISRNEQLMSVFMHLPNVFEQAYGNYGWLDTPTPTLAFYLGIGMILCVLGSRWRTTTWNVKWVVTLIVAMSVMFGFLIDLQIYSVLRGFGLQGRHIMPLLVGVPIIVFSRCDWRGKSEFWVAGIWAMLMVWCGAAALRRYAVGIKPLNAFEMFSHPEWTPKMGIEGTLLLLVIAALAVGFVCVKPFAMQDGRPNLPSS